MTNSYVVKSKRDMTLKFVAYNEYEYFHTLDKWMHQFDSYGLYQQPYHLDGLIITYPAIVDMQAKIIPVSSENSSLVPSSHAQFLIRGQRKYKKSKKERPINRHYDLGKKPCCARQPVNHNQHQGRNKTQFCSQR